MALGIIACGSSIGGTVFPIAFRNLVATVGYVHTLFCDRIPGGSQILVRFKWTMRIFGFILICTLGVANVVRRHILVDVVVDLDILTALSIDNLFL